jgi:HAMP domain-containing protein
MAQFLARGMTSPLREMAAAASAMARGDYGRRVTATSRDEVGELARAFDRALAAAEGVMAAVIVAVGFLVPVAGLGLLALAVALTKVPVFLHGVVLSAFPATPARAAVALTIWIGAAATALGLVLFAEVLE